MTEPAEKAQDTLEADVDAAIALCDGDVRAALRAVLVYNDFPRAQIGNHARDGLVRLHTGENLAQSCGQPEA